MGTDDRVSEKIQTWAGHICRVALILWLSWFARTFHLTQAYAVPVDGRSLRSAGIKPDGMAVQTKKATVSMSRDRYDQPESVFFRDVLIHAHPSETDPVVRSVF